MMSIFRRLLKTRATVKDRHLTFVELDQLAHDGKLVDIEFVNCTFGMSKSDLTEMYHPKGCKFRWDGDDEVLVWWEPLAKELSYQKHDRSSHFVARPRREKPALPPNVTVIPYNGRVTGRQKAIKVIPVPPVPKYMESGPKELTMIEQWSTNEASGAWPLIRHIGGLSRRIIGHLWDVLYGATATPDVAVRVKKFLKSAKLTAKDLDKVVGTDVLGRYAACSALFRAGSKSNFWRFSPEAIQKKAARSKIRKEEEAAKIKLGEFKRKVEESRKRTIEAKKKLPACSYCGKKDVALRMHEYAEEVRHVCNGCAKNSKAAKLGQCYRVGLKLVERKRPVPNALKIKIMELELEEKKPGKVKFVAPPSAADVIREACKREEAALIRKLVKKQADERKMALAAEEPPAKIEDEFPLIARTKCGLCNGNLPRPELSPATRKGVQILPMCGRCVSDMIRHERENWTRNF